MFARRIIKRSRELAEQGIVVEIHWVPGHISIAGNKKEDETAKEAAETPGTRGYSEGFGSLAHVGRTNT